MGGQGFHPVFRSDDRRSHTVLDFSQVCAVDASWVLGVAQWKHTVKRTLGKW